MLQILHVTHGLGIDGILQLKLLTDSNSLRRSRRNVHSCLNTKDTGQKKDCQQYFFLHIFYQFWSSCLRLGCWSAFLTFCWVLSSFICAAFSSWSAFSLDIWFFCCCCFCCCCFCFSLLS